MKYDPVFFQTTIKRSHETCLSISKSKKFKYLIYSEVERLCDAIDTADRYSRMKAKVNISCESVHVAECIVPQEIIA